MPFIAPFRLRKELSVENESCLLSRRDWELWGMAYVFWICYWQSNPTNNCEAQNWVELWVKPIEATPVGLRAGRSLWHRIQGQLRPNVRQWITNNIICTSFTYFTDFHKKNLHFFNNRVNRFTLSVSPSTEPMATKLGESAGLRAEGWGLSTVTADPTLYCALK